MRQRGISLLRSVQYDINWSYTNKLIPPLAMPGLLGFVVVVSLFCFVEGRGDTGEKISYCDESIVM